MSGRSAYVRKKVTNEASKDGKNPTAASRTESTTSHERDHGDATISDYPMPGGTSLPVGTGVGTTNARFLKFSEQMRHAEPSPGFQNLSSTMSISSGGSGGSGGSRDGHLGGGRGGVGMDHHHQDEHGRQRRPTLKTEDVSGIERSNLRSMLDKTSGDVRKGLAKTFTFKRKDKDDRRASLDRSPEGYRAPSIATVRPQTNAAHLQGESPDPGVYYGRGDSAPRQQQQQQQQHSQCPRPDLPDQHAASSLWDHPPIMSPPPIGKSLPPVPPPSIAPPIKRWVGSGRPVQRWNKLRKDPELWDPNGDVLVFLGHRGQTPRPNPSFRLSSHIIEATESHHLITMLREGSTEEDLYLSPSPHGAPPMVRHDPRRGGGASGTGNTGHGGHPTPPTSEDMSFGDADGQISYEMFFPTPANMTKVEQLRYHIATRNVFALVSHASLVGITLCQALTDLQARLDACMTPGSDTDNAAKVIDYLTARGVDDVRNDAETAVSLLAWSEGPQVRWDDGWKECFLHCAGMHGRRVEECADFKRLTPITRALLERASLETQLRVQVAEERLADLQCHDMWPVSGPVAAGQAKAAADRFQKFLLNHYSRVYGCWPPPPVRQKQQQQQNPHGRSDDDDDDDADDDTWLTRTVAQDIQKDFSALYDYLVHRDIVWDVSEARAGRKWLMVSASGDRSFKADTDELPLTDILVEFDNKMRFPHIPHPYPLVPESVPVIPQAGAGASSGTSNSKESGGGTGGLFRSSKKTNNDAAAAAAAGPPARNAALERRVQLAYSEATNIYVLGSELTQSDLIDAFVKFEKGDGVGEVDPALARRGRWVLVYGVLQTLASVAVDAPGARYKDDVPYHLSPRLRGTKVPPWKGSSTGQGARYGHSHEHRQTQSPKMGQASSRSLDEEAAHELSHCWVVPRTWGDGGGGGGEECAIGHGGGLAGDGDDENESEGESEEFGFMSSPVGGRAWAFPKPPAPRGPLPSLPVTGASGGGGGGRLAGARSPPKEGMSAGGARSSSGRREFGGYHEGTLGVYGGRGQALPIQGSRSEGVGEGEGEGVAVGEGVGVGPGRAPRIRDFDLDLIDDAEL